MALPGTDLLRAPDDQWRGFKLFAIVLAAAGVVLSAVGFAVDRAQFFHSYLTAFVFVLTVVLGCLFFVMLQHITRAGWSVSVRRMAEIAAWTFPVMFVLFLPVLAGLGDLFHWTHQEAVEHDPLLQGKAGYLNLTFFLIRAALYFAIWTLLGRYFLRRSLIQDTNREPKLTVEMQRRAAPGIILFALSLSFMAFDWIMSMDPHWYSTIFGVYVFAGTAVAGFAFITLTGMTLRRAGYLAHTMRVDHYQDLGRFLFAFSVFWAYIAFSQFFLIWYGNIPEETIFFVHRSEGTWKAASLVLAVGHFVIPFVLLMSRWVKRRPALVTALAGWMLVIHYWDLYWLIMPNLHHEGVHFHWIDLACLAAVAGVFLTVYVRKLNGHALVPVGDPRLTESLALEHLY